MENVLICERYRKAALLGFSHVLVKTANQIRTLLLLLLLAFLGTRSPLSMPNMRSAAVPAVLFVVVMMMTESQQ